MKTQKVYKVVQREFQNGKEEFYSAWIYSCFKKESPLCFEYQIGEITHRDPDLLPLMAFQEHHSASNWMWDHFGYCRYDVCLLECEAELSAKQNQQIFYSSPTYLSASMNSPNLKKAIKLLLDDAPQGWSGVGIEIGEEFFPLQWSITGGIFCEWIKPIKILG